MIKVTISYRKDTARYNEEDSFLIDTYNHPVALLTAVESFNRKHKDDEGGVAIQYISTRNDEDVLSPKQDMVEMIGKLYQGGLVYNG